MNAVKQARERLNITQAELAKMLGITRSYLSQLEYGYCRIPEKIESKLGTIVDTEDESLDRWKTRALLAEKKLEIMRGEMQRLLARIDS